jgi:hypothetical protein
LRNHGLSVAVLLGGMVSCGWGMAIAVTKGPALPNLALPTLGLLIAALTIWRLVLALVVIPRQTIVWFQYDARTLEYRRSGDADTHRFRTLDVLRIESTTDSRKEIVRYHIRLVGGTTVVIERNALENGDALAEQLAADITNSPRWMFS